MKIFQQNSYMNIKKDCKLELICNVGYMITRRVPNQGCMYPSEYIR